MAEERRDEELDRLFDLSASPGAAPRISREQSRDMVRAAIERGERSAMAPGGPRWLRAVAVAAFVLIGTGVAAAAIYSATQEPGPPPAEVQPPAPTAPAPEPEPVAPRGQRAEEEPAIEPALEVQEVQEDPGTPEPRAAPSSEPESAEDLLARANALRAERRWAEAERLYTRIAHRHARSSQAYVATVAAASLQLGQLDRPRDALRLYQQALRDRPSGTLAAEARLGVARAHRALGDTAAEAAALEAFLEAHDGSPLTPRVRSRLDELRP